MNRMMDAIVGVSVVAWRTVRHLFHRVSQAFASYFVRSDKDKTISSEPLEHVVVEGVVCKVKDGEIDGRFFDARVYHQLSGLTTITDRDGEFQLRLPKNVLEKQPFVWIVAPSHSNGYLPAKVKVPQLRGIVTLPEERCALRPLPGFVNVLCTVPGVGVIPTFVVQELLIRWYLSTFRQKLLVIPAILIAMAVYLDCGFPVPGDLDEQYRETVQLIPHFPSMRPVIRYHEVRKVYHAGLRYELPAGEYDVNNTVVIEDGSELLIRPNVTLKMGEGTGVRVSGTLKAIGQSDGRIVFMPQDGALWSNIAIEGQMSSKSELRYCDIRGGHGTGSRGSDSGYFERVAAGKPVGGGLLLFNTTVHCQDVQIEDCSAQYGGGIYMRNSPIDSGPEPPGSTFENLVITNCEAIDEKLAGGGGVFVKNCNPTFKSCKFVKNKSKGQFSCGGGFYLGKDSRVVLQECEFNENEAQAEGGGIYANYGRNSMLDQNSGLVMTGGDLKGNVASGTGGGISALDTRVRMIRVDVVENEVGTFIYDGKPMGARGGGVFLNFTESFKTKDLEGTPFPETELIDCEFRGNVAKIDTTIQGSGDYRLMDLHAGGGLSLLSSVPLLPVKLTGLNLVGNRSTFGQHLAVPSERYVLWSELLPDFAATMSNPAAGDVGIHAVHFFSEPVTASVAVKKVASPDIDTSYQLPENCYSERKKQEINAVVLHFISAKNIRPTKPYDLESILMIFKGEYAPNAPELSAHYMIGRDGEIYRLVPDEKKAWHAGKSQMPTYSDEFETDVNEFSIGIEMVRMESEPPTKSQMDSLVKLLVDLKSKWPGITTSRIVGHDSIRSEWNRYNPESGAVVKTDPGPLFPWGQLFSDLFKTGSF